MSLKIKIVALALTSALAAGGAYAKGHDQGGGPNGSPADGEPGANAGSETVGAAQTLGAALGNGQDKSGMDRGNSANAGKPGGGAADE